MLSGVKQDFTQFYRRKISIGLVVLQSCFGSVFGKVRDIPSAVIVPLVTLQTHFHANLIANCIPENFFGNEKAAVYRWHTRACTNEVHGFFADIGLPVDFASGPP